MCNSIKTIVMCIALFYASYANSQNSLNNQAASAEVSASAMKISESKKSLKSSSAMEMYKIETNQAAQMINTFVRKNIDYPELMKEYSIETDVMVDFFINDQGVVQKVMVAKGGHKTLNEKLVADLSQLKDIKIKQYLGASRIRIPINFSLQ